MKARRLAWLIACLVFAGTARAQDERVHCISQLSSTQVHTLLSRVEGDLLVHQRGASGPDCARVAELEATKKQVRAALED